MARRHEKKVKKGTAAVRTKAQELEHLIAAAVMQRRVAISDIENPARVQREIERLEERIARDQREVASMKLRLLDGKQIVRDCDARIAELRASVVVTTNTKQIDRLLELEAELQALRQATEAN